ncbi:MAG TPA: hypothetical protein H9837_08840 [Candidatus Brachybacterium merdigallinarum]|nr:hypothetical protein [Candidatus Brachybacterium merdigallinarum]
MTFRIECTWEDAPDVRAPELAATWARLRLAVDDQVATLVKEKHSPQQVRESIDVSAYPLAEWLALNWWELSTSSHRPGHRGIDISGARDGFPWPALTLLSDRAQMWVRLTSSPQAHTRVSPIGSFEAVLERDDVLAEIARFIDATVRRLEDAAVTSTLLQEEWEAIRTTPDDVRTFTLAAAAWGEDPYDIDPARSEILIAADEQIGDLALLTDLARVVALDELPSAQDWLASAVRSIPETSAASKALHELPPVARVSSARPWQVGYEHARQLRAALGLPDTELAPVDEFVALGPTVDAPPVNIDALVRRHDSRIAATASEQALENITRARFIGARSIARQFTSPQASLSLLTTGSTYTDRLERAFAAEFLAPAAGVRELLEEDFSEESQARVASHLRVTPRVIEHQIENQIAA